MRFGVLCLFGMLSFFGIKYFRLWETIRNGFEGLRE